MMSLRPKTLPCQVVMVVAALALYAEGVQGAVLTYVASNLTCYDCSETFKNFWNPFTACQNNLSSIPLIQCHEQDRYCRVERTTLKGMTISISRGCAEECLYGCRAFGYGITTLRCTSCCQDYACNDDNHANTAAHNAIILSVIMTLSKLHNILHDGDR